MTCFLYQKSWNDFFSWCRWRPFSIREEGVENWNVLSMPAKKHRFLQSVASQHCTNKPFLSKSSNSMEWLEKTNPKMVSLHFVASGDVFISVLHKYLFLCRHGKTFSTKLPLKRKWFPHIEDPQREWSFFFVATQVLHLKGEK